MRRRAKPGSPRSSSCRCSGFACSFSARPLPDLDALRPSPDSIEANLIELDSLNDLDRKLLKETMRIARQLQQRIELDYSR